MGLLSTLAHKDDGNRVCHTFQVIRVQYVPQLTAAACTIAWDWRMLPGQVPGVPRSVSVQRTQIHLLQTDRTRVLLAHQRPASYALIMEQVLACQLN